MTFTAAGSTIGICASQPATFDAPGYASLSFTNIGEVTDIGTIGAKYNLVTHMPLASRTVIKRRGSKNNGTLAMKMAASPTDAGQIILKAALNSDISYSFVITLQSGTKFYFTAQTMDNTTTISTIDTIVTLDATLEIDSEIISV